MRYTYAAACGLLWAFLAGQAAAWDTSVDGTATRNRFIHDVKIGALAHDVPLFGAHKESGGADLNVEVMFAPSLDILGGTIRPALGATFNFAGYTSKVYLDARWQVECCWGFFFTLGIGAALHDGDKDILANILAKPPTTWPGLLEDAENHKQLGLRVLFHPSFELGYRLSEHHSVSIYLDHISNANTASKNEGLDTLGIRYGYRF